MNPEIQKYIDDQVQKAKLTLIAGKEYRATIFQVFEKEGRLEFTSDIIDAFLRTEALKKLLVNASHAKARAAADYGKKLQCAFLISDAFVSVQVMKPEHSIQDNPNITYKDYIKPINDPKRMEGIMLCLCLKNSGYVKYFTYTREGNAVHFSGKDIMDDAIIGGGHFSKLFPPDL